MEENEKKAAKLLDESAEEEKEDSADNKKDEKAKQENKDPGQLLRELCRGKLELLQPFRAHSQDVTEVEYDFCGLTNEEVMDALDSVPVNNMFAISNQQAMALFAATAGKCAPKIDDEEKNTRLYDARDIKKRLGPSDAVKAIQLAKLFYNASSQAGRKNNSKE